MPLPLPLTSISDLCLTLLLTPACAQNPGVFADPDAAYVLGFSVSVLNELTLTLLTLTLTLTPTLARPSPNPKPDPKPNATHTPREVIMLNTDAHSSQIKNKMTKVTRT